MISEERARRILEIRASTDARKDNVKTRDERVVAGDEGRHQRALKMLKNLQEIDEYRRSRERTNTGLAGDISAPPVARNLVLPTGGQVRGDDLFGRRLPCWQVGGHGRPPAQSRQDNKSQICPHLLPRSLRSVARSIP